MFRALEKAIPSSKPGCPPLLSPPHLASAIVCLTEVTLVVLRGLYCQVRSCACLRAARTLSYRAPLTREHALGLQVGDAVPRADVRVAAGSH
eukprot:590271-Rhodomonas_salina.1